MRNQDMIRKWIEAFIRDCRVRDLSHHTIEYYRSQLAAFEKFCQVRDVSEISDITPDLLRAWLLELKETHNPGGVHAKYRAVRAFLFWYEREAEPEQWKNPMAKVKPPKVERELIQGASIEDVRAMLATCDGEFLGVRDRALMLCLLDTGARAGEFLAVNLDDVDLISGAVILRKTKARKPRVVFLGKVARRALRAYLKKRTDEVPALWVSRRGDRLAMPSLQGLLKRRGRLAHLRNIPSAHDYRRAHALMMLRAGTDVITLARLMAGRKLDPVQFFEQGRSATQAAHAKASPADKV